MKRLCTCGEIARRYICGNVPPPPPPTSFSSSGRKLRRVQYADAQEPQELPRDGRSGSKRFSGSKDPVESAALFRICNVHLFRGQLLSWTNVTEIALKVFCTYVDFHNCFEARETNGILNISRK